MIEIGVKPIVYFLYLQACKDVLGSSSHETHCNSNVTEKIKILVLKKGVDII